MPTVGVDETVVVGAAEDPFKAYAVGIVEVYPVLS